jgi:hypothetical protein
LFTDVPGEFPMTPYADAYHKLSHAAETGIGAKRHDAWLTEVSAETAKCMKQAGFAYYPHVWEDAETPAVDMWEKVEGDLVGVPYLPDEIDQVRRWGYGVTPTDAAGQPEDPFDEEPSEDELKNQAYVESLDPAGQAAYQEALTGWDGREETRGQETGGCGAEAAAKHPEPPKDDRVSQVFEVHGPVGNDAASVMSGVAALDPEVRALDREWAACMLGQGHDLGQAATDMAGDAGQAFSPHRLPAFAHIEAFETDPDGDRVDYDAYAEDHESIPLDQRSLVGSQAEIDVAVADFECRQETDYMDRLISRMREIQEEHLAKHQKELDAFMAAVEELNL